MKKYIRSFLLLATIMLTHTVYAGEHTPGEIKITFDPIYPANATLEAEMNFKHNPASGCCASLEVRTFPNLSIEASNGVGTGTSSFKCYFYESTNPQLYADAMLILDRIPASSKLTVTGLNYGECNSITLITSSAYGEEKIIHTVPQ